MDEESDEGFSFLFSKLCELTFNNEANRGWDIYRRPRYTDRRRKTLKLCFYETLFEELRGPWVGELARTQYKTDKDKNSSFRVVDKLSIATFKLRLARRFDDADKLDHLVCQWRNLKVTCSSAIDFSDTDRKPVTEKEAVLRFLVALSGSVANDSVEVIGHQNDLWTKGPKQIQKTSLPDGPLLITDSRLLRQGALEFDHYVHYSRELFECPPVLPTPGCGPREGTCQTQQIFEELPGTFKGKARFFTRQDISEDVYEKNGRTHAALFSALVHSRTDDMQVKLELPQLPSASNTLHSLATEQREIKLVAWGDCALLDNNSTDLDLLETVFEDGVLIKEYTFAQVRANAEIPLVKEAKVNSLK